MAHLTAGDITPIGQARESTYGTDPGTARTYYGDIAEGGGITPTDTPNPYLNWRYTATGARTYDPADYVNQQKDAGFSDNIECRDQAGWSDILKYAGISASSTPLTDVPSRTVEFGYKNSDGAKALKYTGCKTDQLRISAEVPGGVVRFEETVLAARIAQNDTFTTAPAASAVPAVQWRGGVTLAGATVYPQSFSITIRNNLGRVHGFVSSTSQTVALAEGRQEIELEFDLWMEDFAHVIAAMNGSDGSTRAFTMSLGSTEGVTITAALQYVADGSLPTLLQDKQRETLRFRASSLYYTVQA